MKLQEVNLIRFIAITTIVFWHCFCCPTHVWGLLNTSPYTHIVSIISSILIPGANMPLFVCISGYLFAHLFYSKKQTYTSFNGLVKNKFHRLVIPFLVIGTVGTLIISERPNTGIIWGDGSSMWFCIMLFWCTLLRWLILYFDNKYLSCILLLLCIAFYFAMPSYGLPHMTFGIPTGLLCFSRTFYYYPFFVLGDNLYKKRTSLEGIGYIITIIFFFTICSTLQNLDLSYISYVSKKLMPLFLIQLLFSICIFFVGTKAYSKVSNCVNNICLHSFGIYAIHEEISWISYHNEKILDIFRKTPFTFAIMFTFATFMLCYLVTHYCLKTKVGRYLLS